MEGLVLIKAGSAAPKQCLVDLLRAQNLHEDVAAVMAVAVMAVAATATAKPPQRG